MADPFVAEIRIFGFNFAPKGWATCDGQLLPISQNTALFSLVGTYYGGDGKSTFALPDLQDSCAVGAGQGPGLSERFLGEQSGTPTVTLLQSEVPSHTHILQGALALATTSIPSNMVALAKGTGGSCYKKTPFGSLAPMAAQALPPAGGDLPHNNMMPHLALNFCIALQGIFPARN
jgi:microcystin-dependent protein